MTEPEIESLETRLSRMPEKYMACRDYVSHGWQWPPRWSVNDDGSVQRYTLCLRCGMGKQESFDRRTGELITRKYVPADGRYFLKGYGRVHSAVFRSILIDRAVSRIERRKG